MKKNIKNTEKSMVTNFFSPIVQRNGRAVTSEDLIPLVFAGYAHFTFMQVRSGKIRGLDLHLERLRLASMELFGQSLPDDQVQSYLRLALKVGPADISLMAAIYSPSGEFTVAGTDVPLEMLTRTGQASSGPKGPLKLAAFEYERFLPTVKHVGEVAKTYFLRRAVEQGFDDAAFVDHLGRLSEGSIWNLAFWDGKTVVWPVADKLAGITMSIVRRQLNLLGVPQRDQEVRLSDLPELAGAVVMNSWTPGVAVHRIGSVTLPDAPSFLEILHRAYLAEPLLAP